MFSAYSRSNRSSCITPCRSPLSLGARPARRLRCRVNPTLRDLPRGAQGRLRQQPPHPPSPWPLSALSASPDGESAPDSDPAPSPSATHAPGFPPTPQLPDPTDPASDVEARWEAAYAASCRARGHAYTPPAERAQQDAWLLGWVRSHGTKAWQQAAPPFQARFPTVELGPKPNEHLAKLFRQRAARALSPAERTQLGLGATPAAVRAQQPLQAAQQRWLRKWVEVHGSRAWQEAVPEFRARFPAAGLGASPNKTLSNMYRRASKL